MLVTHLMIRRLPSSDNCSSALMLTVVLSAELRYTSKWYVEPQKRPNPKFFGHNSFVVIGHFSEQSELEGRNIPGAPLLGLNPFADPCENQMKCSRSCLQVRVRLPSAIRMRYNAMKGVAGRRALRKA